MPVYEYLDTRSNRTVELCRPVAERDLVPAGLRRITVPRRIAVMNSITDPHSAEGQVPKAFRQLEAKTSAKEIARETGYTVDQLKKVWAM
ncbi:MAG TPA: hypothetical protein VHA37_04550 [Candidatus Saccharimonadales bacterium]|nr:hypothetical protein [Candidatus Saccharimonadales bacterium]